MSFDPLYVEARKILLDALVALAPHGKAVIVVGAQAVYLRTNETELAVAPYTTDGDLALDPSLLGDHPELEKAMGDAGFRLQPQAGGNIAPGVWLATVEVDGQTHDVPVDLIVPEGAATSGGRRGARLGAHGNRAARRAVGLEATLVDHSRVLITALDPTDRRSIEAEVAGPEALFVAKAHKLNDRIASRKTSRIDDKDAADVVRLMQSVPAPEVRNTLNALANDPMAGETVRDGIVYLRDLFARRRRPGIEMAARAMRVAMDASTVEVICTAYMAQLDES
ncbi:MAG TPA: hypothetical protein VGG09_00960 [Acidimicrobiales bacterium]